MISTVDAWLATLAILIAIAAAYTTLERAASLSASKCRRAICRTACGALALGVGVWCVNLLAVFAAAPHSWQVNTIAVSAAAPLLAALGFAGTLLLLKVREPGPLRIVAGAAAAAAGLCASYWSCIAALGATPPAGGMLQQLSLSFGLSFAATAAALWLRYQPGRGNSWYGVLARLAALLCVALALLAAHADVLARGMLVFGALWNGAQLTSVAFAALGLGALASTHVATVYEGRLARRTMQCARELEEVHTRLQYLATHDSLTGLPNGLLFRERLAQAVTETSRSGRAIAVAIFDLDRFSSLNHSLGHGAGDWLLAEVARRVGAAIRPTDLLARLGSDEFVVLIDSVTPRQDAEAISSQILAAVAQPLAVNGVDVAVRPSIGVSVWPDDGRRVDDLLAHAEVAMAAAKAHGGRVEFFQAGMTDSMHERLALENDLRRGLAAGEFELCFQPMLSVGADPIEATEALVRWRHPQRGVIGPNSFIPLAEETGLMIPLGEWVLREVCRRVNAWRAESRLPVRIAVNLSATQFRHQNLAELIRSALEAERLDADCLEIELTESAVMTNPEESVGVLRQLRKMGITVAIDDFGTGYSSLSYLRRFPIDKLKIDRSFVRDLPTSRTDESIVRAIISLAHSVGMQVVAEGVESEEQLRCVHALGCDQWQGYYCCEPQTAEVFGDMLAEQSGTRTGLLAVLTRS